MAKRTKKDTSSYKTVTVQKGDNLVKFAIQYLGDPLRYTEIVELNGLDTTAIKIGQILKIPVLNPEPETDAENESTPTNG